MFGEAFGRPSNITLFVRTIIHLRYLVVTKDAILHLWLKSSRSTKQTCDCPGLPLSQMSLRVYVGLPRVM